MKAEIRTCLAAILVCALTLISVVGCASTKETKHLLSSAGFKVIPASTAEQKTHLQTLRSGKVTMVVREGKTYYVYPDKKQQVLYIGQQEQFDLYQELRLEQKLTQERMRSAQKNSEGAFAPWGAWSSVGFVEPVPVYSR